MTALRERLSQLSPDEWVALASLVAGLAVFALARGFLAGLGGPKQLAATGASFEDRRRSLLRQGSASYRALEPLIDLVAGWNASRNVEALTRFGRELQAAGEPLPWQPAEHVALRQVEGVLIGLVAVVGGYLLLESLPLAILLGGVAGVAYTWARLLDVAGRGRRRLLQLKRRLPYAVDLMALMMEAGAGFHEALATAVQEAGNNPVAEEFGTVLREVEMGVTRRVALLNMQTRLEDRDISELIFAIVKGEEMGTPMAQILRGQSDQLRLKRTQQAERESAEAQVIILFPGVLVMIACVLLLMAPFLLQAMGQGGVSGLF